MIGLELSIDGGQSDVFPFNWSTSRFLTWILLYETINLYAGDF